MAASSLTEHMRDAGAGASALLADCYDEVRRIARSIVASHSAGHVFHPTDLAHEAAARLLRMAALQVNNRAHMLALAARVMRQSLIDELRRGYAAKRRAPEALTAWPERDAQPLPLDQLDDALTKLKDISEEHAEIVELRFTLGMTVEEIAAMSGMSERTVKRRWQAARAMLHQLLAD